MNRVYKIGEYLQFVVMLSILIPIWRSGVWRNWREYYPTVLFIIVVNFGIDILTSNRPLWFFHKRLFIPNHTLANLIMTFTNFVPVTILYLSRFPFKARLFKQIGYIAFWVAAFSCIEGAFMLLKQISYHNKWNYGWSIVVWIFMFISLRLHHTKPLWAWMLCLVCTVFLITYFQLPIKQLR